MSRLATDYIKRNIFDWAREPRSNHTRPRYLLQFDGEKYNPEVE